MAARWGAGEETLTAYNMDFFPLGTLDEAAELSSGETLEALQSCLDPSILSMFEDTSSIETKGVDEESEATLLTALTEILDNVDDENLSPFDTLPDSDLLSGQKGREHSPLRRLLCMSLSPPEKDTICSARPLSTGKSLPRMLAESLQRSDGEEEEDGSITLSPVRHELFPDKSLLDWEGLNLPLPVNFEQECEDGMSVSLGDLVRHMHPYCMAICVENDEGEQILPEGGILLEVVDQGENGEPILAFPDMDLPIAPPLKEQFSENEQKVSNEAEVFSDSSEHIVVDDEDETIIDAPGKVACPASPDQFLDVKDEMITKRQKEEIKAKSPSRRKKRKKSKTQPKPVERRVLRSASVKSTHQELKEKPKKMIIKEQKKIQVPKVPVASAPTSSASKPKKINPRKTETQPEIPSTTLKPETSVKHAASVSPTHDTVPLNVGPVRSHPRCPTTTVSSQQPIEMPKQSRPAPDELICPATQVSSSCPAAVLSDATLQMTMPVVEPLLHMAPVVIEPKPKSLSLAEYRRLRQQKKPEPVENQDDNRTKWPSLPEPPKELPPIPCLPDPTPRDPRRPNPQAAKKEDDEIRPAWQPRGPCAPPTPEALLVPPAYMVASSSKVSAATAITRQQTQEPQTGVTPKPAPSPKTTPEVCSLVKPLPTNQPTTAKHAVNCVPQSSECKSSNQSTQPGPSTGRKCPEVMERLQPVTPQSVEFSKAGSKTTTKPIQLTLAPVPAPSCLQKTTLSQRGPEVIAPTSFNKPSTSSKPTTTDTQPRSSPSTHPLASQTQKGQTVVLVVKQKPTTATETKRTKSPTEELIEAFTSEIGIEAADMTSLLEQFEETQAKEEQCVPEVSGRAAAVGNSSVEFAPEKRVVDRVRANDLSSTAGLTPPATPPHQMWKPLAPMALLGKNKAAESSKSPSKIIQIEARPLPSVKHRGKPTANATPIPAALACLDHDYCLPVKGASTGEAVKRWNVKQQSFITIKPIKTADVTNSTTPRSAPEALIQAVTKTLSEPLDHRTDRMERTSVLETPDASPARQENEDAVKDVNPRKEPSGRSYRWHSASGTPSPRSSPKERTGGRCRKRSHRSPSPESSGSESYSHSSRSRSRSHSPSKKRFRPRHSQRNSSSSSRSSSRSSPSVSRSPPRRRRYSYSSSRSGSWSRSRSRSRSPQTRAQWSRGRRLYSPSCRSDYSYATKPNTEEVKKRKETAIEERRVVYVGRIRATMTQKELKERFSFFGEIEECTLHFREHGDNYGFVTYYNTKDAFTAIESGSKLRQADELPFDLCFGGRRQFCQTSYSDLDSNRDYKPLTAKGKFNALDFDTLLKQAQQNQKR